MSLLGVFSTERQQEGQKNHGSGRGHGDTRIGEHEPDAESGGGSEEAEVQVGIREELGSCPRHLLTRRPVRLPAWTRGKWRR